MPSYLCPLAESHPGSWGPREAGKQVGEYQLQSLKKTISFSLNKHTHLKHIFCEILEIELPISTSPSENGCYRH